MVLLDMASFALAAGAPDSSSSCESGLPNPG